MGSGYRKEWLTPIDFPVLDLATFGGGLTPVRQVGGMQSLGLALKGKDGKSYTFRATDKDPPTKILPPEWADSVPAKLFQDATAANHPGNGFVVPALAEAAGVLHTNPRYVFMPDDPALGEFRKTFGGEPGTIEEFPLPGPNNTPHGRGPRVPRGRVVGQVARLVRRRDLLPDVHAQHGAARSGRARRRRDALLRGPWLLVLTKRGGSRGGGRRLSP